MLSRFLSCLVLLTLCATTHADVLVVMPDPQQIMIGSSRTIDIRVGATGTSALLDSFSAKFLLTPLTGSQGGGVQFVDPQSDLQNSDSDYVFVGNSLNQTNSAPASLVSTTTYANDQLIGGDATVSATGFLLDASDPYRLLFRLELSADNLDARVGDQFYLTLIDDAGLNPSFTHFWDPDFNDLSVNGASFQPTLITVVVPEPCSLCGSGAAVAGAVVAWRRRKRKPATGSSNKT
ncbi:MAG: hypothetical protein ACKO2P_00240 [Planctomycetota bacterium]